MLRELILFSANLSEFAWYQTGAPPAVRVSSNIDFELISDRWPEAETPALPEFANPHLRLDHGDVCVLGRETESNKAVYCLWLAHRPIFIEWIFGSVTPPPEHGLLYNAWVHPDHRGSSLHWAGAARMCQHMAKQDKPHFCAGVERHEFKLFATKYAQVGLGVIAPYASLWGLQVFGKAFHMKRPARQDLLAVSQRLRGRYSNLFPGSS